MDRSQEPQTVPAGLPAVLCPGPSAPSRLAAARARSASASKLPALASRADNLLPSFQSARPTSPHRAGLGRTIFLRPDAMAPVNVLDCPLIGYPFCKRQRLVPLDRGRRGEADNRT